MKQIIVTKSIAYGAKLGGGTISGINEINLLDTGAIAVFTENNVFVTAVNAASVMPDVKKFYIAVGNQQALATSKTYITVPIPRLLTNYQKKNYVAPVKLVKYIGYDGTTVGTAFNFPTLVAGEEAFIRITDTTAGLRTMGSVYENEVKRYSTLVKTGDTATLIANRLILAINNDTDSIVVAAAVGATTGISLTAKNFGTTFSISLDGIMTSTTVAQPEGSTVGVSVAINYGIGTEDEVTTLEDLYSVERGNDNRLQNYGTGYYKVPSLITSGGTYDLYQISWFGKRATSVGEQNTMAFEVIVAMPDGATEQANFETIMAEVFGNVETTETGV